MRRLALLTAFLGVAGCSTVGPAYTPAPPPPEGQALVYVMRTSVGYGNFWPTVFSLNDTKVVSLYDKGYSWIYVKPGRYKISAGTAMNSSYLKFVMPVEAQKEYFVEYTQEPAGYRMYRDVVRAVDKVDIADKPKE
jgi:hypothetical protein